MWHLYVLPHRISTQLIDSSGESRASGSARRE
jgi:hypothetical protein